MTILGGDFEANFLEAQKRYKNDLLKVLNEWIHKDNRFNDTFSYQECVLEPLCAGKGHSFLEIPDF